MFRKKLRAGELDDQEIELDVADTSTPMPMLDIPGQPGSQMGMMNIGDVRQSVWSTHGEAQNQSCREP